MYVGTSHPFRKNNLGARAYFRREPLRLAPYTRAEAEITTSHLYSTLRNDAKNYAAFFEFCFFTRVVLAKLWA